MNLVYKQTLKRQNDIGLMIARGATPAEIDAKFGAGTCPAREIITPANDIAIGKNAAGEQIYQRGNGDVYRIHYGRPDFGGDLVGVA